jgi:hypothetical protein
MEPVTLRAGTGWSGLPDARAAGAEAARAARAPLGDLPIDLVMVFATPRYDLPALLEGVRSITTDALLVGCTGSGEIVGSRYLGFGGGVGVLVLGGGRYRFAAASAGGIGDDLDRAGRDLTRAARDAAGASPHAAALLLTDSLLGDLQAFVQGVYRVTGPSVALTGGAAGDEQRFVRSSVFHDDRVLDHGALVLWIASDHPFRVACRHGWTPVGTPLLVTRAEGTRIAELGGRPAAEAYEAQLKLEAPLSAEAFWPTSIRHPFGITQADGTHVIRVARSKGDDGGLAIVGCVPPVGASWR